MEFGQSMTALEPPIQYVPNRAPPGQYLAPEVIGVWLFPRPAWAPSALCLVPTGRNLALTCKVWTLVVGLWDFANFYLFITWADWWYVSRLCRCWDFSTAGFLPFSHGSWWLTAFLNISVHQYLALWREEIRLSVNVKCAELKPAIFRVFNC